MATKAEILCSDCDDILQGEALKQAVPIDEERVICSRCRLRRERGRKQGRYHRCKLDELYSRFPICGEKGGKAK